jgi:hypothetical protein
MPEEIPEDVQDIQYLPEDVPNDLPEEVPVDIFEPPMKEEFSFSSHKKGKRKSSIAAKRGMFEATYS